MHVTFFRQVQKTCEYVGISWYKCHFVSSSLFVLDKRTETCIAECLPQRFNLLMSAPAATCDDASHRLLALKGKTACLSCMKGTTITPESFPNQAGWRCDEIWKDGWRIVVELLDQAEGMAHSQGHLEDAKYIERCNRMIEKCMSADMNDLPDVCRLWNLNTDWKGDWPRFLSQVGKYQSEVEEAIPALENLRLLWQEKMEQSLPEASWIYKAECQLEAMRETLKGFKPLE